MSEIKTILCDYDECTNSLMQDQMTAFSRHGDTFYACPDHVDAIEDRTGYCGLRCQFGRGCDHSC